MYFNNRDLVHIVTTLPIFCFNFIATFIATLIFAFAPTFVQAAPASVKDASEYAGCASCHSEEVTQWHKSDHYKSMGNMDSDFILGDFSNVTVKHYSQTARFYRNKADYLVDLTEQGQTETYRVKHTFGHYPLQQYLVSLNEGALQVFPFSWDSRSEALGGQKWFPIYANEDVKKQDRLHWQQPLLNWNGMCADCHSDGLKRNYDLASNQFSTQFDRINVGCQSCHGKVDPEHGKKEAVQLARGHWQRNPGDEVAKWTGEKRDNQFMDTCFSCHSLRAPLLDGIDPYKPFLDQFTPDLLSSNMYFADGQIKEEVYVYGSFLQSKMYAAGVNCLDCHDKHTMKIKVAGNGLCLQCHNSETYEQVSHTRHDLNSDGGQCVNCHMPERTYMGVDPRRDHSFVIPRPKLSINFAVPNACTGCHDDKDDQWAAAAIEQWGASKNQLSADELEYLRLQQGGSLPLLDHLRLANSDDLSVIKRASVISLLPSSSQAINEKGINDQTIKGWVDSDEALIRLAVANIGYLLPEPERLKGYAKLLSDPLKAIRVAAASNLAGVNLAGSKESDLSLLTLAIKELVDVNDINSWRGEGHVNQSILAGKLGNTDAAIQSLQQAIKIDPYFYPSYLNLAEYYRIDSRIESGINKEQQILLKGISNNPKSAALHYAMGMYLIRKKNTLDAVASFKKAKLLEENNVQYAYLYFLSLDHAGQTQQALQAIKSSLLKYSNNPQLIDLGLSFSKKLMDRPSYQYFWDKKRKINNRGQ